MDTQKTKNEYYLHSLLSSKHIKGFAYSSLDNEKFNKISGYITDWKNKINARFVNKIEVYIEKSGSREKGDAIKGDSDLDLFVSIHDSNNNMSIEEYYYDLYSYLVGIYPDIRKQNVSIGINDEGTKIDITPAKRINYTTMSSSFSVLSNENHYIHLDRSKSKDSMMTNIQKQIMHVKNHSNLIEIIVLMKMWRNCHCSSLPSIAIEILTIDAIGSFPSPLLIDNVKKVLQYIANNIRTRTIVDPGNPSNNLADDISYEEKEKIGLAALYSLYNIDNFIDLEIH